MKHVAVDASVAVTWLLPEAHLAAANQLLADDVVKASASPRRRDLVRWIGGL